MPRKIWFGLLASLVAVMAASMPAAAQQQQKPNIVIIWGDDIGQSNISAYSRGLMGYQTPNIDRVAAEGMMFTDYYAEQSCTAGRASFITGQSGLRTGLTKVGLPGAAVGLQKEDPTIAELLTAQGYATGQFGKNHLGDRNEYLPTVHGFDEFYGNLYHLNAEEEPELPDYPKDPAFRAKFGPRGVLDCKASATDDPTVDPRFGKVGKQASRVHLMKSALARALLAVLLLTNAAFAADPLPSWNDGPAKQGIISFVELVTTEGSPAFVPPTERIATFDNDGTLWCEQPLPVQMYFALDRVKALAAQHPEWKTKEPFASLLKGDLKAALAGGDRALLELVMATHAGMTTVEFEQIVKDWIAGAKHPKTGKLFTGMVYQPMLEVLAYLRANGFKTFIVSGGGIEFMRPWTEQVYGIPPEQIVGSSIKTKFERRDGKPVLVRLPELNFNDDKADKPVGINQHIGRRPIAAFGNSVGDKEMLEYTQGGSGARFMLLVLHDDAAREYAYGPALGLPDVKLGAFTPALFEQAKKDGWTVVSMKNDWKAIFPPEAAAVTAIDILLEPDATMLRHAEASNARLLKVYPKGFALDAAHRPHITLMQRFVRTADLDRVYAAAGEVFASANVIGMKLEAFKYYYIPSEDIGVAGIVARPTPDLLKLQADLIAAVAPFTAETGPVGAFTAAHDDPALDAFLIQYVSKFVPEASGGHFNPHVTTGIASREYLDKMLAEPFESFTFSPAGAAVYQLGQFGTAAKKLKEWELKR